MSDPIHDGMTIAEVNACRCDVCVRMNCAVGIGETLAGVEDELQWLPARVEGAGHDRDDYAATLRFVADFHALKARLLGGGTR